MPSRSMSLLTRHTDPDTIHQALDIVVPGFYEDPVFAWMFHELDAEQRREKIWKILRPCLKSAPVAGGFILDAKDWGAAMAVTCPGQKYDSLVSIWKSGGVSATFQSGLKPTYVSQSWDLSMDLATCHRHGY